MDLETAAQYLKDKGYPVKMGAAVRRLYISSWKKFYYITVSLDTKTGALKPKSSLLLDLVLVAIFSFYAALNMGLNNLVAVIMIFFALLNLFRTYQNNKVKKEIEQHLADYKPE